MGGYVLFEMLKSAPALHQRRRPRLDTAGPGQRGRPEEPPEDDRAGRRARASRRSRRRWCRSCWARRRSAIGRIWPSSVRNLIVGNPPERVKAFIVAMMERADSTPLLAKIEVPALVMHGAEDALIPPAEAEGMHRAHQTLAARADTVFGPSPKSRTGSAFRYDTLELSGTVTEAKL